MWPIIIRRLLWLPFLLLAVSLTVFLLGTFGPGDPAVIRLGPRATPERVAQLREELGLNRPLHEQYLTWLGNALQGDFGESYRYVGVQVVDLLGQRMLISIELGFAATLLAFVVGIPLGVLAAYFQGTWLDRVIVGLSLVPVSVPTLVMAPIIIFIFVRQLQWFPTSGWDGLFSSRAVLPVVTAGLAGVAGIVRIMRVSTLDVLFSDFVRTARAKGLSEAMVARRHVLRVSLLPVWTGMSGVIAGLPFGLLFTEAFFGIPGVANLTLEALFQRDYPIIQAVTLLGAALYVIANTIVDVGYPIFDPRIRSS